VRVSIYFRYLFTAARLMTVHTDYTPHRLVIKRVSVSFNTHSAEWWMLPGHFVTFNDLHKGLVQ
jgi:hypothetical protein